ncbi:MAG TPA: SpoIVB peptidase [Clostridiales bacterium]|nr:SpoIVB peptidase [Clostridiales bacterium]
MKQKYKYWLFVVIFLIFVMLCCLVPYRDIMLLNDNDYITQEEYNKLLASTGFVKAKSVFAGGNEDLINEYVIKFKLFNLFNIKNLKVNVVKSDEVLLGGDCIGLNLKSKGVIIVGSNYIITKNGNINPMQESGLNNGDIILKLNDENINSLDDIKKVLDNSNGDSLTVTAKRDGNIFTTSIKPQWDIQTRSYKLGIWIRDDAMGVGTLTFVNPDNHRFASLGHAITDSDTNQIFEVSNGEVYKANVVGVKKGKRGSPGEILGFFMQGRDEQGTVDKNCDYGVYGYLNPDSLLVLGKSRIKVGGKLTAKPGKASILCCVDGETIEEYSIELIKTNYQIGAKSKNMVIKITDPRLIEKTGGIIQGMSGSPIIQDGKLIGAVTHVFVNDATKGFGLYLDFMINE